MKITNSATLQLVGSNVKTNTSYWSSAYFMARHSLTPVLQLYPSLVLVCLSCPGAIALHFQWEKLYFHRQAMKCLCMTVEHTTINLTPAELTGQKPMQPLLGTEHYQCMDSLFIRGSIRHCSLRCHTEYETNRQ